MRSCSEALLDFQLHRVINRIAVVGLRYRHIIELRKGQIQLSLLHLQAGPYATCLHRPSTACAIAGERVVNQCIEGGYVRSTLGEKLRRQLIEILIMHGQACSLGASIGDVNKRIAGELALDVEVPLLDVRGLVTRYGRFQAVALHDKQSRVSPERWSDSARKGVGKKITGSNAIGLRCVPSGIGRVNEEVMGCIVPTDIHREIKDPITGSDNSIFIELIGNSDARADVVPRIVGHATRVL